MIETPEVTVLFEQEALQNVLVLIGEDYPFNIQYQSLKAAAEVLRDVWYKVITEVGLQRMSAPKPAPLGSPLVMRTLVMLRALYSYEVSPATAGGVPTQGELCDKVTYEGLIRDMWVELGLEQMGYQSCNGAPHIQQSAHLLSDTYSIIPRHLKGYRTPYTLQAPGRIFAFYLFGEPTAIRKSGRSGSGYTGLPAMSTRKGVPYSPWMEFLGLPG